MTLHPHGLRPRLRLLAGALLLLAVPAAAQTATPSSDLWYVVTIAGQPVGSVHEMAQEEDGAIRSRSAMRMVLNRMGSKVEMGMTVTTRESPEGKLQGMDMDLLLSTQATASHLTVEDGVVRIRDRAGDREFERTVPFTGEILGPEGIRRRSVAGLVKPGDRIELQTWVADLGAVRRVTRTVLAEETVAALRTRKIAEVTEGNPAERTVWLDADGQEVQTADPGPFGEMRTLRVDEASARLAEGGGSLPEEMYAASLIPTAVRIPDPRHLERLVLRLRHREPGLGWPPFDGTGQKVLEKTAETLTLEITRQHPRTLPPFPIPKTAAGTAEADRAFLQPNAYVQSDDPRIRAAAEGAVAGSKDVLQAGLALQRWVTAHMQYDLGIVFAPSTEVFASRRGTCAGYAMLLTTMARSVGIPARYVMGYVYLDGTFGGHAWTEIKVGDGWIPIDAAVPTDGPADAAHLAVQTSSLAEGIASLSAGPVVQMFGHLEVEVVEVGGAGEPAWNSPAGARPYTVPTNN